PGAAHGYCVGLLTPASLAGDCKELMSRAQHLPIWQGQLWYAVPPPVWRGALCRKTGLVTVAMRDCRTLGSSMASQECSRVFGRPLTLALIKARMNII